MRRPPKTCGYCGRLMAYRKKWERVWDDVKYCSKTCRSRRFSAVDRSLEDAILELLNERAARTSICPSEAARRVRPEDWRTIMEQTRCAARRLAARDRLVWLQKGRPVDPSTAKGPVRLRLRPRKI